MEAVPRGELGAPDELPTVTVDASVAAGPASSFGIIRGDRRLAGGKVIGALAARNDECADGSRSHG